jgi:hypothetical protein
MCLVLCSNRIAKQNMYRHTKRKLSRGEAHLDAGGDLLPHEEDDDQQHEGHHCGVEKGGRGWGGGGGGGGE